MTEEDQKIVDTARRLKVTVGTEGWQDILGYVEVRRQGLKNTLAKMDLTNELTKACRKQGELDGIEGIPNRIDKVFVLADKINEAEAEKKKKK